MVVDVTGPTVGEQVVKSIGRAARVQRLDVVALEAARVVAVLAAVAIAGKTRSARALPSGSAQFDVVVAHRIALHGTLSGWPMPYPSPCNRGLRLWRSLRYSHKCGTAELCTHHATAGREIPCRGGLLLLAPF